MERKADCGCIEKTTMISYASNDVCGSSFYEEDIEIIRCRQHEEKFAAIRKRAEELLNEIQEIYREEETIRKGIVFHEVIG